MTTNTDTATFNSGSGTITVDANRDLKNIVFDTGAGSFTLTGGSLLLTSGGTSQITSMLTGNSITEGINSPLTLEGSYTFANNSATTTNVFQIGGTVTSAAASGTTTLTLTGTNTGTNSLTNVISNGTGTNKVALTKSGLGTWILNGASANTYTGTTTINGGTLVEDFANATSATNLISSSSALAFGSGSGALQIMQQKGVNTSQTFAGTTFGSGATTISGINVGSGTLTIALQALTRNAGGTVNFILPTSGSITTSTGNDATGILGTYATTGTGTSLAYATVSVGNIAAYTGTSASSPSGITDTSGTVNYALSAGSPTGLTGSFVANTVQYTGTSAGTIDVGTGASTSNTLTLNGLMNAGSGGLTIQESGSGATGGLLIGASKELVITGNSQTITISAVIKNSSAGMSSLVFSGAGQLTLTGANSYTGGTVLNSGTLNIGSSSALGASGTFTINGGTINNTVASPTFSGTTTTYSLVVNNDFAFTGTNNLSFGASNVNLGSSGVTRTITVNGGMLTFAGNFSGSNLLGKSGSGSLMLSSGSNAFAGVVLNAGRLILNADGSGTTTNQVLGIGTVTINGGTLTYGTLAAGSTRTVANAIIFGGDATLVDGTFVAGSTLAFTGTVNLGGTARTLTTDVLAQGALSSSITTAEPVTMSGTVSNGGIIKAGPGVLVLSGANTYTGDTTVRWGTLTVGANAPNGGAGVTGALGNATSAIQLGDSGSNVANPVNLLSNGAYTVARDIVVSSYNSGGLTAIGGSNTSGTTLYSGTITLGSGSTVHGVTLTSHNGGTVNFSGTLRDAAGITTGTGGLVTISGSQAAGSATGTSSAPTNTGTVQLTGANTFTGGLNIGGDQIVDLANTSQTVGFLENALSLPTITSGGTGYTAATVAITGGGGSGATATVTRTSGAITGIVITNFGSGYTSAPTFTITGAGGSGANVQGNFATSSLLLGSGNLTISGTNSVLTPMSYNGAISGTGGVYKNGAGTQIFTGASTYSGGTTISAGALYANNTSGSATGTGAVTVSSGATLAGSGTIAPASGTGVTMNGTLSSGGQQSAASNTIFGSGLTLDNRGNAGQPILTINSGSNLSFSLGYTPGVPANKNNFTAPITSQSTFLNVLGNTNAEITFTPGGADTITLVDLTVGSDQDLALRYDNNPYLLIAAGADIDYSGLYTTAANHTGDGYVLGVTNVGGGYTPFTIQVTDINGNLTNTYTGLQLYLYNGDLEVVPEPSNWAMLLGGGILLFLRLQRRAKAQLST